MTTINFLLAARPRVLAAALFAFVTLGCENIALMPRRTIEQPDAAKVVTATVNGMDHTLRELYLRTDGNQHYVVNYTTGTRVTSRGGDATVNDLRNGDQVRVELREGSGRRLFADEIRLERAGGESAIRTIEGTVERIVAERGFLELRTVNGRLITAYLPEAASSETRNRFQRIGVGDIVRIEGERLDEDRLELLAFR